jgi:hypothetical protein
MHRLYASICELRRRKVYRAAAAYAVAGWLAIQVVAVVSPAFRLPDWDAANNHCHRPGWFSYGPRHGLGFRRQPEWLAKE